MSNYNIPSGSSFRFEDYISTTNASNKFAIFPSILQGGGYQEFPTINDRNQIPSESYTNTRSIVTEDGYGSGRRKLGMSVLVMDSGLGLPQMYILIPRGYFGNVAEGETSLGIDDWNSLSDEEKILLLDPATEVLNPNDPFGPPLTDTQQDADFDPRDPNKCWVTLSQCCNLLDIDNYEELVTNIFNDLDQRHTCTIQVDECLVFRNVVFGMH